MWKLLGYNLPVSGRCEDREEVTGADVNGAGPEQYTVEV